jgi:hypothetical protein
MSGNVKDGHFRVSAYEQAPLLAMVHEVRSAHRSDRVVPGLPPRTGVDLPALHALDLLANQPLEAGCRHLIATSLNPKHQCAGAGSLRMHGCWRRQPAGRGHGGTNGLAEGD